MTDRFRHRFAEVRAALAQAHPHFDADFIVPGRTLDDPAACRIDTAQLQFMHLRHTAIVRLAESGATDEQIAAVTGHSLRSVASTLQFYLVKTRRSAAAAFDLRLERDRRRSLAVVESA